MLKQKGENKTTFSVEGENLKTWPMKKRRTRNGHRLRYKSPTHRTLRSSCDNILDDRFLWLLAWFGLTI
jgi:hypothetical protein